VGAILEKSRLQGVIKGTPNGELLLEKMMSDERVEAGDQLLTSGGDQIFPKGLPIGIVKKVSPGKDVFLNVQVKPAAELSRLDEVLVITQVVQRQPSAKEAQASMRAVDILASRLPSIPDNPRLPSTGVPLPVGATPPAAKPAGSKTAPGAKPGVTGTTAQAGSTPKPRVKSGQTAEAQLTGGAVKTSAPKPKAANSAANTAAGVTSTSAGGPPTVTKKPRAAKPTAGAATGASNPADQKQPGTAKAEDGSGSATAAPNASAPPNPPTGMAQNPPPATPPAEPQP